MFQDQLQEYVFANPKLVSMKLAGDGIYVLKYKRKVFYDDLWNDYLEHCRGTIVDADFNIVSYPFTKIYNYGIESAAPVLSDDTEVTAFRKVNGFMVAVTFHNGDVLVSTTGSTDSDFVVYAKEMMLRHMRWADWQIALNGYDLQDLTFMFECVHPDDPHIIPEQAGMYILGYREKSWGSRVGYNPNVLHDLRNLFNCYLPEYHKVTMAELKKMAKECKSEGYVAYTHDGVSFKIKSPFYLTSKWVARNPRTDKLMRDDFKNQIDEEYYPLLEHIKTNIEKYTALSEQSRLEFVRQFISDNS
jgi:hypothetical protein